MRIGVAADHGGFSLKESLSEMLREAGHEVVDFGGYSIDLGDDYPDYVLPLAHALADREVDRGIAVCGSGVGAALPATKSPGCGPRWSSTASRRIKESRMTT